MEQRAAAVEWQWHSVRLMSCSLFGRNRFGSTAGRIGCALSHYTLYQHIANASTPGLHLVLEDDAEFIEDWMRVWNEDVYPNLPTDAFVQCSISSPERHPVRWCIWAACCSTTLSCSASASSPSRSTLWSTFQNVSSRTASTRRWTRCDQFCLSLSQASAG